MSTNVEERVEEKKSEERKVLIKVNGLKTYYPVKKGIFRRTVGHLSRRNPWCGWGKRMRKNHIGEKHLTTH